MKNTGIRSIAQHLQSQGRGRDTILAHIMPEEAAMLKSMGGRGSVNPRTGLLEFGVDAGPDAGSTGSASGNSYGGSSSVSPGLSGFGGGSSSPGGVDSSGNTNPSVGGGGGGGGGGFINEGRTGTGGGGMLTARTPAVSTGGQSFFGGNTNWTPTTVMGVGGGGSMNTLGVPTLVANALSSAAANLSAAKITSLPSAVANVGNIPLSTPPAQPQPIPETQFQTAPVFTGSPTIVDILSTPSPNLVPAAQTATQNAYNWSPGEETRLAAQVSQKEFDRMFGETAPRVGDWGNIPQGVDVSANQITNQIVNPAGIVAPQPTQILEAPRFRSEAAMEPPQPVEVPRFRSEAATAAPEAPQPAPTFRSEATEPLPPVGPPGFRSEVLSPQYSYVPPAQPATTTFNPQDVARLLDTTFSRFEAGMTEPKPMQTAEMFAPTVGPFEVPDVPSYMTPQQYFAQTPVTPTVPNVMVAQREPVRRPPAEIPQRVSSAPAPAEIPQQIVAPTQVASLLEEEFSRISTGGDGGRNLTSAAPVSRNDRTRSPTATVTAPASDIVPTGMDLQRRVYVPSEVTRETISPAYS